MPFRSQLRSALMLVMILGTALGMSGCAELLLLNSLGTLAASANGPTADPNRETETNRHTFDRPIVDVYSALVTVVERDGRKIVDQDHDAYSMVVSYPFSWLENNWGGVVKITCMSTGGADANRETTVRVMGGARDSILRIRRLGESILRDVTEALEQRVKKPAGTIAAPCLTSVAGEFVASRGLQLQCGTPSMR